jgi:anti-sigma B factor antagonist
MSTVYGGAVGPLEVRTDRFGTSSTVFVLGELDLLTVERFDAAILEALTDPVETLVIDLAAVSFIDSSGIRELLYARRLTAARDVRLVIVPAPERIQRVFSICRLDTVLPFGEANAPEASC